MNLRMRSNEPELMDSEGDKEEIKSALSELKLINKFLGGNSVTVSGLKEITDYYKLNSVRVLDTGSGTSDILFQNFNLDIDITSLDKNVFICRLVKENGRISKVICGDAMNLPFSKKIFDVVHASLFLHHFSEKELTVILGYFCSAAKYGVLINDLQRSYLSYYGFKLLTLLFSKNRLVKNDGLVSIRRGFRKRELIKVLEGIGYKYKLEKKWAFRWLLIVYCNERI
jgi:hypothetical protein